MNIIKHKQNQLLILLATINNINKKVMMYELWALQSEEKKRMIKLQIVEDRVL